MLNCFFSSLLELSIHVSQEALFCTGAQYITSSTLRVLGPGQKPRTSLSYLGLGNVQDPGHLDRYRSLGIAHKGMSMFYVYLYLFMFIVNMHSSPKHWLSNMSSLRSKTAIRKGEYGEKRNELEWER